MIALDLTTITCAAVIASIVRFGGNSVAQAGPYAHWVVVWVPLYFIGLLTADLYTRHRLENPFEELRAILKGVTMGAALAVVVSFSLRFELSRAWAVFSWAFALVLVAVGRFLLRRTVHAMRRRGRLHRRVVIVGAHAPAARLMRSVERAPWEGLDVVGFVATDDRLPAVDNVLGDLDELRDIVLTNHVEEVLVAPGIGDMMGGEISSALDGVPVDLRFAPGLDGFLASRIVIHPLGDRPLLAIERAELRQTAKFVKRAVDLIVGTILLLLAAPVMAVCAIAIKIESRGAVFFRQRRVGLDGREFTVWKLRSMVQDAEARKGSLQQHNEAGAILFKLRSDPRVTRVGSFLRRSSLDELPQLINVLTGSMTLVGPRPPLPEEVKKYDARISRRLRVKPGVTGLWQVSGRHQLSFEDYVRFDLLYVQNWSIALDLFILAKTIPAVLLRKGAY